MEAIKIQSQVQMLIGSPDPNGLNNQLQIPTAPGLPDPINEVLEGW
ncbi:MAG: hypothetical protein K6A93_01035 [Bacteroidaceae bacterium]|nr:hypothetical protein [Bacteroidaceae bacterium]